MRLAYAWGGGGSRPLTPTPHPTLGPLRGPSPQGERGKEERASFVRQFHDIVATADEALRQQGVQSGHGDRGQNAQCRDRLPGGQPGGGRLASPAVVALMRQRTARLGGLALGLLGLTLLLALASYNPSDPSFDTATMRHASNLAGPVGAFLADLLLQGFGLGAALPGIAMLAWAWRIASYRGMGSVTVRVAATLMALPALAAGLRRHPAAAGRGLADGCRIGRRDRDATCAPRHRGRAERPRPRRRGAGLGARRGASGHPDAVVAGPDRRGVARRRPRCGRRGARVGLGRAGRLGRGGTVAGTLGWTAAAVPSACRAPRGNAGA